MEKKVIKLEPFIIDRELKPFILKMSATLRNEGNTIALDVQDEKTIYSDLNETSENPYKKRD